MAKLESDAEDTGADLLMEEADELLPMGDMLPNEAGSPAFNPEADPEDEEEDPVADIQKEERDLIRSASPALLKELDQWFANEIDATDSVQAAVKVAKERKMSVEEAVAAFDIVRELLSDKRAQIKNLKEIYRPELSD